MSPGLTATSLVSSYHAAHVTLAQLAFQHLPRRVPRQSVHEHELTRDLRTGEPLARKSPERGLVHGRPRTAHHERAHALPEVVVGNAHDGDLAQIGMVLEHALDLGGIHVDAAGDDHVALPAFEEV